MCGCLALAPQIPFQQLDIARTVQSRADICTHVWAVTGGDVRTFVLCHLIFHSDTIFLVVLLLSSSSFSSSFPFLALPLLLLLDFVFVLFLFSFSSAFPLTPCVLLTSPTLISLGESSRFSSPWTFYLVRTAVPLGDLVVSDDQSLSHTMPISHTVPIQHIAYRGQTMNRALTQSGFFHRPFSKV